VAARSERQLDAVIVGGGVIGLACAWRAAEAGLDVVVLEREAPGAGASNVAAGMLAPVGEASWGEERLLELTMRSHELWPEFARELAGAAGRDVGYADIGSLHLALDRDEAAELHRRFELMQSLALDAEWLRPRACRELEPGVSPSCVAGVHAPHESAVDPRALTAALVAACKASGVRIATGEATGLLLEDERVTGIRTAAGERLSARSVVVAAGSWSAAEWLPDAARPPVRPVKGQILTLAGRATEPVCERIVVTERIYVVPRSDGRLMIGATVEEQGFDTSVTAGGVYELLREAYRVLPETAELELVETLAGLRPTTPDNLPLVGPGAIDGLLLATGHFRNGILLAPLTAERIAAALAQRSAEVVAR